MLLRSRTTTLLAALASVALTACFQRPTVIPEGVTSPFTGYSSALYRDGSMWVCRPDLPSNPCAGDLSATEIAPDGSRTVEPFVPVKDPEVDCFFVYPTVDMDMTPGNHTDFSDTSLMRNATLSQAARFQEVCRVFAPLYRQITVGTYAGNAWNLDRRLDIAFSDLADAFAHYLGQYNKGRKVVILGHSQGAYMTVELLKRFFDRDPVLRPRLLVGLPIGGRVEVPPGEAVGGTFANLPLCSAPAETGCVVAFRAYREGAQLAGDAHGPPKGLETGCVHPAVGGDRRYAMESGTPDHPLPEGASAPPDDSGPRAALSRSYFVTRALGQGALDGPGAADLAASVRTPFVLLRGLYSARCVPGAGGFRHLAISEMRPPGDARPAVFNPADPRFEETTLGLHSIEMWLAQGDLIDLVARKARAARASTP